MNILTAEVTPPRCDPDSGPTSKNITICAIVTKEKGGERHETRSS